MDASAKPKSTGARRTASDVKSLNAKVTWTKPIKTTKPTPRFAICVDNSEYPASLELHKIYRVLSDKEAQADGDMRIIDESGEDYLFPADYFIPIELPPTIVRALNKSFAPMPAHA